MSTYDPMRWCDSRNRQFAYEIPAILAQVDFEVCDLLGEAYSYQAVSDPDHDLKARLYPSGEYDRWVSAERPLAEVAMVAALRLAEKHLLRQLEVLREDITKMEEAARTATYRRFPVLRDGRVVEGE